MKKKNEYFFIIVATLIIFLVLKNVVLIPLSNSIFTFIINPLFWIIMSALSFILLKDTYLRYKNKYDKLQIIIIILLVYLIVYFSSGLVLGFENSPYSHSIGSILLNVWALILVVLLKEYTRFILIKNSNKDILNYCLLVFIFTLFEVSFVTFFSSITTLSGIIEYFFGILIPLLAQNALLTYLMITSGFKPAVIYKLFIEVLFILLPIFPKTNWFINGLFGIMLPFITFIFIYNFIDKKNTLYSLNRRYKKASRIPLYLSLIVLILFFYGAFRYRPVGVMSNSMKPIFERGDAVIIENINKDNINTIEIGTIIMYNLDSAAVIHRVVEIVNEKGVIKYRTKGDNNNAPDASLVSKKQILGIEKFSIPKIGYPSVILESIISKQVVGVET